MQRTKAILIDYDGVVLRSPKVSKVITKRCEDLVGKIANRHNIEEKRLMNKHLYRSFGHTAIGLRACGFKISNIEFNNYIYNNINYHSINNLISENDFDLEGLKCVIDKYKNNTYIFSNAPRSWIEGTMQKTQTGKKLLEQVNIIDSIDELKPDYRAYIKASDNIGRKPNEICIIDDSLTNVYEAERQGWKGVLVSDDKSQHTRTIKSLQMFNFEYQCNHF